MLKTIPLSGIFSAGQHFSDLFHRAEQATNPKWQYEAMDLRSFFEVAGCKSTIAVGADIWETIDEIRRDILDSEPANKKLTRERVASAFISMSRALYSDIENRQMAELKTGDVSERLRDLPTKLALTDPQKHLLDEVVRCLECEAYRSAAVMGWNLAYDFIRQWILSAQNRLAAFNNELVKIQRRNRQKFQPIGKYDDFFGQNPSPGEREVLDVCEDAQLIVGKLYETLCHYLRQRNELAHPNTTMPSMYQVNTYIEHLIDIITGPPFK
jgi:hypothetical protein